MEDNIKIKVFCHGVTCGRTKNLDVERTNTLFEFGVDRFVYIKHQTIGRA